MSYNYSNAFLIIHIIKRKPLYTHREVFFYKIKIIQSVKIMNKEVIEEKAYNYVPGLYKLMLEGLNLREISEKSGLDKYYILMLFKSENFHLYMNIMTIYYHIYSLKYKNVMQTLLDGFTSKLLNNIEFFKDPDDYIRDFYYVGEMWVKKDLNGEIVERFEPLESPGHHDDDWFKNLRKNHRAILHEHFV